MHQAKTFLLMLTLTVLLVLAGGLIAGEGGLYFAFILALIMNIAAYWFSDKIAIAMTRSRPLPRGHALPETLRAWPVH